MDKKNEKLNVEVFDYSTIPKFMQEHGRFCLWKLVMKPGKTKPDKIPYRIDGKRADATNLQHYSSFNETVEAFTKGGYAGIGIGCFEPLRLVNSYESVYAKVSKSKQADKFNALWNGEIPEGKSQSEADMALAEILAFWCGGDIEQMDRLFRRSSLMRDKWDRIQSGSTYGMITLAKAVKKCTAFYSPMMATADEDFNDILRLTECNLLENKRYRSGDIGYGRLFADMFKEIARYVPERKKWFVYDGKRWVPDIANLKIMELGKDLAVAMLLYTSTIKDEEKRLLFLKESKYWQQRRFRETYIKEAQSVYPVPMERFDSNKYLFNCNNVTFDLRTHIPKEHSPEDFLTKISPVDYDPDARSERFD